MLFPKLFAETRIGSVSSRARGAVLGTLAVSAAIAAVPSSSMAAAPSSAPGDEVTSLATATTRTFRQNDGTVVKRIFAGPVNFKDARGAWHHIDTTLKHVGGQYQAAASEAATRVPESLGDDAASVTFNGTTASMGPAARLGDRFGLVPQAARRAA